MMPIDGARRDLGTQLERTYVLTLLGVFVVVLIWYWMLAPLLARGVWPLLEVPETRTGRKATELERDVYISIDARGRLFFNERPVTPSALVSQLMALEGRSSSAQVFVRVDKAAPFGAVREVIVAADHAKQRHLVFLARPLHGL